MGSGNGSGGGDRHELRVTVGDGERALDVTVEAAGSHRVGELAEQAADLIGRRGQGGLWCERRGVSLDPGLTLGDAGIRWGDRLLVARGVKEPTRVGGSARVELVLGAGPRAGERWELGVGSYRVGRDLGADIFVDDPSISRHHLDLVVGEDRVGVIDAGSANGTAIDGQALSPGTDYVLGEGDELELGRTLARVRSLAARRDPGLPQRAGRLDFNRPPRVGRQPTALDLELPPPPSRGGKARLPLAAALLPLAAGVLLFLLLNSPVMLAIAGLSPLMAIGSYLGDRRGGKKSFARASAEFRDRLTQAVEELDGALVAEAAERRAELPDAPSLLGRVRDLEPSLWERRPADGDFLALRVGVADLPARSRVSIGRGGDAELRAAAEAALAERRTVTSVPVPVEMRQVGALGLTGSPRATAGLARWLVLQAAVLHGPGDLVIVAALSEEAAPEWSWLKWLPHLRPGRLGLTCPAVAVGREEAERMLAEVGRLLGARRAEDRPGERKRGRHPQLLLLVDERLDVDRSLLGVALAHAAEHEVAAIWLGRDVRDLPGQTGAIAEVRDDRAVLDLTEVSSGARLTDVSADSVSQELAVETARQLAPIRDAGERGHGGGIPQRVSLLEALDLLPVSPRAVRERWERWDDELRVVVGAGADGPLGLDLRSEGPHALIAGTTGSGKSELLRTFVASATATVPPDRLSFLLIDYKGGSAFAPCAALPHVVDVVSDLDEHMAERALISLEAELKRRERTLAEHGSKDLRELARRDPGAAPPSLVIAVDEFAKLREEVPEFVDGVVDIAQRGRSLGVHMVLAAQTLRNAFTPAIRANTNLRIALRVADDGESEDVLASPAAARIPSGESFRGRGFVRTGSGESELRELQTAYVSGRSAPPDDIALRLRPFDLADRQRRGEGARGAAEGDAQSDLAELARAAGVVREEMRLADPPPPWLPLLPEQLDLEDLGVGSARPGVTEVGLIDLPHLQRQDPLVVDLPATGNVVVFGAGNSGKTTFLTSTALALSRDVSPQQLCLYALDAASGHLAPLSRLPHCGGVVSVDDEERVDRLFRELLRRIERQATARRVGAAEAEAEQTVVLLLDDLGSFAQQYDRPGFGSPYERLQRVLAGGRAASVHVVLTAARRGDLPAALAAHVGQRYVLRMPTEDDMRSLGLDAKATRGAKLPPGRGFTQASEEFQVAVPVRDGVPLSVGEATAEESGPRSDAVRAIEVLPGSVARASLGRAASVARLPLGLGDEDLEPVEIDLGEMHFLISGPYRSGRSTALQTIAEGLRTAAPDARMLLLAPRRSPLRELDLWDGVEATAEACAKRIGDLLNGLKSGDGEDRMTYVLIDDGGELSEARTVIELERLVRLGRDGGPRVVAAVESAAARGIGLGWVRELRREGHGLLLQPDLAADGDLLGARLPHRLASPSLPGRGFLVRAGIAELVQVGC